MYYRADLHRCREMLNSQSDRFRVTW